MARKSDVETQGLWHSLDTAGLDSERAVGIRKLARRWIGIGNDMSASTTRSAFASTRGVAKLTRGVAKLRMNPKSTIWSLRVAPSVRL